MLESFLRFLMMAEPEIISLPAQAGRARAPEPERSQFSHLLRHFLERFFNHEGASPDGDAKARLVQIAFAAGLPGFVVSLYLWPIYHPFRGWPPGNPSDGGRPPYWLQANHHLFFVVYSFVVMGLVTVFEWDLFFPDLLDVFVLKPLPVVDRETFLARVSAIAILLAGFLFDANFLAPLALPAATDPPNLPRFLAGHLIAVAGSGICAAGLVLALECVMLSVLGERYFRRISLFIQGLLIAALLVTLLLFPVFSGVVPRLLQSGSWYVRCIPPLWFLGMYQRLLEGPAAQPIYTQLARIGCWATLVALALAVLTYPVAYLRKTRQLLEGLTPRRGRSRIAAIVAPIVHTTILRIPEQRAIFHYITQTLFRIPRYRIYLVLYGGVGLSILVASVLRFSIVNNQIQAMVSADGVRASAGIAAFWAVAGLRLAFLSPGNRQGSWLLHFIHGRPPEFGAARMQLSGAKLWVLVFVAIVTGATLLVAGAIAPPDLVTWRAVTAQVLVAAGMCLLLTDLFFLQVTTIAFSGEPRTESPNLAMTVTKYFTFFPLVIWLSVVSGRWMEEQVWHFVAAIACIGFAHWLIELRHREVVRQHCLHFDPDNSERLFLLRLDLREYSANHNTPRDPAMTKEAIR